MKNILVVTELENGGLSRSDNINRREAFALGLCRCDNESVNGPNSATLSHVE